MHPDAIEATQAWFLHWRVRQAAAVALLGVAAVSPGASMSCEGPSVKPESGAPSVVILIDQSNSMREGDPGFARYRAAEHLLERIHTESPDAEAALIVFSDILHFDWRDDAYFQPAFPANAGLQFEAYVPFTRLDRVFADGRTGLDTLRGYLATDKTRPVHATRRRSGFLSDFPMALDAARSALRNASARPARQSLVLITDGEVPSAISVGGDSVLSRCMRGMDLPATFILQMLPAASVTAEPAASLRELVAHIAANGYSTANPRSAVLAETTPLSVPVETLEAALLAHLRSPIPEAPVGMALTAACPDSSRVVALLRAGNSLARVSEARRVPDGRHWLIAAPPGFRPSGDWSCCRAIPGPMDEGDSARYIHVTVESEQPFAFRARVFSRLGEPVTDAGFSLDERSFRSLAPVGPNGLRKLEAYWDGHASEGEPVATGAYVLSVETHKNDIGATPVSRTLTRRVGVLRER